MLADTLVVIVDEVDTEGDIEIEALLDGVPVADADSVALVEPEKVKEADIDRVGVAEAVTEDVAERVPETVDVEDKLAVLERDNELVSE